MKAQIAIYLLTLLWTAPGSAGLTAVDVSSRPTSSQPQSRQQMAKESEEMAKEIYMQLRMDDMKLLQPCFDIMRDPDLPAIKLRALADDCIDKALPKLKVSSLKAKSRELSKRLKQGLSREEALRYAFGISATRDLPHTTQTVQVAEPSADTAR